MARGVNKVIIVGNCGQDPETRFMPSGGAVTNLSIATSESWKDKNTGDQQERTEWHRVVFFNRLAEIAGEYVKKGSKLYVEGSLRTRKWQGQDGQDRYTTEIVASEMQMLTVVAANRAVVWEIIPSSLRPRLPNSRLLSNSNSNSSRHLSSRRQLAALSMMMRFRFKPQLQTL